ncbi:MAG: 30S ribosomal protein S19 [Candidatus Altiarchaeota archaeon]|nr:30S ribosomal protein S19 [Candidatus Altiarchaeota archaeon]
MVKTVTYYGKEEAELVNMSLEDFIKIMPARQRRTLKRGFTPGQKILLEKVREYKAKDIKKPLKTHCRDMLIVPEMVGILFMVYNGKEFKRVEATIEMLGHYLGEFSGTRRRIQHGSPGVGATRSSKFIPLK